MNFRNIIFNIFSYTVIILFFSCSSTRILDSSVPDQPTWIHGIEQNYIIEVGSGSNHYKAKMNALQRIKERIALSVAQRISATNEFYQNEIRINHQYIINESFTSFVRSQSDNVSFINGISVNQADAYYWETWKERKEKKVYYYIKYPLDRMKLQKMVDEWVERDKKLTEELERIRQGVGSHTDTRSLINDIYQIKHLSDLLYGQRKNIAAITMRQLIAEFKSIHIEVLYEECGILIFRLEKDGKTVNTYKAPVVRSNCARKIKTTSTDNKWSIKYDYGSCKLKEDNFLTITFDYDFYSISQKVPFDVSEKMVGIEVNENISFQSLERDIFSNNRKIKCMIPVNALSSLPFKIERVELHINRRARSFTGNSIKKQLPTLIFDNLNFHMQGKGMHYFKITFNESLISSLQYNSNSDFAAYISGKIFYYGIQSGKRKVYQFNQLPYSVDW